MAHLTIPGELPDMNKIIAASKSHYGKYSSIKKSETEAITWLAKKLPKMGRVQISFTWYCKNKKKDPDNIAAGGCKVVLDGLVEAGVLENDGWTQIAGIEHHFEVDKQNPRVEIEILEV